MKTFFNAKISLNFVLYLTNTVPALLCLPFTNAVRSGQEAGICTKSFILLLVKSLKAKLPKGSILSCSIKKKMY